MAASGSKEYTRVSQAIRFLRKLFVKRSAQVGALLILLLFGGAVLGPALIPYDPFDIQIEQRLKPPSWEHLFGTDEQGRDLLSRVAYGSRYTIVIMLITTSIAVVGGVGLGLPSAYYGGRADMLIMRIIDVMLGFPYILLILAIVAIIGPSLVNAMIAIGIANIPGFARVARSAILVVKEQEYVDAERALGAGNLRIMFHTVLPNILSPIIVMVTLSMPSAVLSATSLSFLGLGAQPPNPEWGSMMVNARDYLMSATWVVVAPGMAIFMCVLGINLLGNALRDVLDPRDKTIRQGKAGAE
ncbi:MAG: ABC transporter permease [Chloroflexota bacterium]|nr:MAG: ABC transporter permease [Chloroflexota bacterium]